MNVFREEMETMAVKPGYNVLDTFIWWGGNSTRDWGRGSSSHDGRLSHLPSSIADRFAPMLEIVTVKSGYNVLHTFFSLGVATSL